MSKIAHLGLAIQGLSMIAMLICVFLLKPVSDIWVILFKGGTFLAIVPGIIGAMKQKEK